MRIPKKTRVSIKYSTQIESDTGNVSYNYKITHDKNGEHYIDVDMFCDIIDWLSSKSQEELEKFYYNNIPVNQW